MRTFLSPKSVYPWTREVDFFFRGYFIAEGHCLRGSEAIAYLKTRFSNEDMAEVLRSLNGVFSMIWEREGDVFFAVDRLRGLPLFYAIVSGELWIGDDAAALAEQLPQRTLDEVSAEEYLSSEIFVSGFHTLLEEMQQVQASEFCIFSFRTADVHTSGYFRMVHEDFLPENEPEVLCREFYNAYERTGKNLVKALRGRTAVIPLSGGADSRMIATLLKREGYSKVICYTYGRKGNAESEISRKIAESLGYPWYMVPYTKEMWRALRSDSEWAAYEKFAFAAVSTPHLQDYLAVKYLKEHHILPEDSVFVPGHSGDLLAGSHITSEFLAENLSKEAFLQTIIEKFYVLTPSAALMQRIEGRFPEISPQDMEGRASQSEWFNTQERQGKYIVNSVRIYEFFGYEWLIPLWDNEQFDFWRRVPLSWRYHRKLYFYAVQDRLPSTNDVTAAKSLAARVRSIPGVRTVARRTVRFFRYWNSPLEISHLFSAKEYFHEVFFGSSTFSSQTIASKKLLEWMRMELNSRKG